MALDALWRVRETIWEVSFFSGLTLEAAIAANLASGIPMVQAVKLACRYVEAGIRTATDLGHGNGPINHFHSTYTLPFAP